VYVYGFFLQYTGISALNYASVYLAILVYFFILSKFVKAHRVIEERLAAA